LNSNFIILDLGTHDASDVVFVEGLLGQFYVDRAANLQRYRRAFEQLRAIALKPDLSLARMGEAKSYHGKLSLGAK